jgi:tRNA dimethylallyltransferase
MRDSEGRVFVVQGPTASGKTSLAISIAKRLGTEIISADSRQFYREMSIGTAKPTLDELRQVKHHFIHSHSIREELTASGFAKEAKPVLDALLKKNGSAVIVGGSGMFIDALTLGLDEIPHDKSIQQRMTQLFEKEGLDFIQEKLRELDPAYYEFVDRQNPVRLIRALEVIELTGRPFSELRKGTVHHNYQMFRFGIQWKRPDLYKRIDDRVDLMMEEGLLNEAKGLFPQRNLKALNTVGYRELFSYWENEYSYEIAVEKIKQHTRNYAKRQLTWLKRYEDMHYLDPYSLISLEHQVSNRVTLSCS